jgi:pimeloyl-ACP methyl ester carboxylesterase
MPVVILHGNASLMQDFLVSGVYDALVDTHRVIVLDRPGYGYSTRPRARTWTPAAQAEVIGGALETLGCGAAVVVGHSWGVLPALALARRQPERVRSLVLLSGYYFPVSRADVAMAASGSVPVIGDILRYTITPVVGLLIMPLFLRALFSPASTPDRFRREFPWPMLLRPRQLRASLADGAMMTRAAEELSRDYRLLTMQTTIVAGENDRIVDTAAQSHRLRSELPNAEIETVPVAGHMIQHIAPDIVTRAIRRAALAPASR